MVDRRLFTPDGSNPPHPVVINEFCTVPTPQMANLLAALLATDGFVLEIGTGSGYQTAVLAERCKAVVSVDVELFPDLRQKLPENVAIMQVDGIEYDTEEQFDGILVTFACEAPSENWVRQLKLGARLVMPLAVPNSEVSPITVWVKVNEHGVQMLEVPAYAPFTKAVRKCVN